MDWNCKPKLTRATKISASMNQRLIEPILGSDPFLNAALDKPETPLMLSLSATGAVNRTSPKPSSPRATEPARLRFEERMRVPQTRDRKDINLKQYSGPMKY